MCVVRSDLEASVRARFSLERTCVKDDSVVVVEWFERAKGLLGKPELVVSFEYADGSPTERLIKIHKDGS